VHRHLACLALLLLARPAAAIPELYDMECGYCHVDDTPTCAGCHNHHLDLRATPSAPYYAPGERVSIAVTGAALPGWFRTILYDDTGNELARTTGPTGTGDDGRGPAVADSIIVPHILETTAPVAIGTYTWRAAYFGVLDVREGGHGETWVPVTITVSDTLHPVEATWSGVKDHYAP
jgi:hypothetical protein